MTATCDRKRGRGVLAVLALAALAGCFSMRRSGGGGRVDSGGPRAIDIDDIAVPEGYQITPVAMGLDYPTAVTFDEEGRAYVVEAGYSYGETRGTPRLVRIEPDGKRTQIAAGKNPPWDGVAFANGNFYVSEGGVDEGGRIIRIGMDGSITPIVEKLPSMGDHHTNGPVLGPDGKLYFSIGTATNSGYVGEDNYEFGWLKRFPEFHDVPCRDVKLSGKNYKTKNPLTGGEATTGPYLPFGTPATAGQVVRGAVPCSGAVLRVGLDGGEPELVAWGFRNPYGLGFGPDGMLYVAENQFDERGSRPVYGVGDLLWRVDPSKPAIWYGWPDYYAGKPVTDMRFKSVGKDRNELALLEGPNEPPKPVGYFGCHASANSVDFSRSEAFGYVGQAFVALFGDMSPATGKVLEPIGFNVARVDVSERVVEHFAVNRGNTNGPASWQKKGGLERPISTRFSKDGKALYVVDFGQLLMKDKTPAAIAGTGVLWRITKAERKVYY